MDTICTNPGTEKALLGNGATEKKNHLETTTPTCRLSEGKEGIRDSGRRSGIPSTEERSSRQEELEREKCWAAVWPAGGPEALSSREATKPAGEKKPAHLIVLR